MDCDHQRNPVILLRQYPAQMCVPRVAMNNVGIDQRAVEISASTHRAKHGPQRFRTRKLLGIDLKTSDNQVPLLYLLIAETAHFNRHQGRKFPREIFDMNTCASVGVRRIFVGKEKSFQDPGVVE